MISLRSCVMPILYSCLKGMCPVHQEEDTVYGVYCISLFFFLFCGLGFVIAYSITLIWFLSVFPYFSDL